MSPPPISRGLQRMGRRSSQAPAGLDARAPDLALRKGKAGGWGGWEIQLLPQGEWVDGRESRGVEQGPFGWRVRAPPPTTSSVLPLPPEPSWELGSRPWCKGGAGSPKEPVVGLQGPDSLGPSRDSLPARMMGRTHSRGPSPSPRRRRRRSKASEPGLGAQGSAREFGWQKSWVGSPSPAASAECARLLPVLAT